MNASGRPNTCKSNGKDHFGGYTSGARVSNAYVICLWLWDNTSNEMLIPDDAAAPQGDVVKVYTASKDGLASD